ncbi:MAG: hypothetical protein WC133_01180 [Candidatus Omnitrophota bacterium]
MRVRWIVFVFILMLLVPFRAAHANSPGYWKQMGLTFGRGVKNLVSWPYEIPYTIAKHDRDDNGNPRFFRDTAGFFDGTFRAVTRLGCGAWDVLFSVVPGAQNDLPLTPEAFF